MNCDMKIIYLSIVILSITSKVEAQSAVSTLTRPVNQSLRGYTIKGRIQGLEDGVKVVMALWNNKGYHYYGDSFTFPDSAYVKNGEFHLSGFVPDGGPRRYWMEFYRNNDYYKTIDIWIDNGENIKITGPDINSIDHEYIQHYVSIEGSPSNNSKMCLEPARFIYSQTILKLGNKIKRIQDSIGFSGPLIEEVIAAKAMLNHSYYVGLLSPDDYHDPVVLKANAYLYIDFHFSGHASFWMNVYKGLDEKLKNTFHGRWLKEIAILSVGQPFPEFNLPSPDGKGQALKDIVTKGKLTIVHFWSANSLDRKKYQDEIRVMYKRYHGKGLNVVGLFHNDLFDKPEGKYLDVVQQWKDVLKVEQFPWYNVIDAKGKDGPVENVYREAGRNNTTNVVLDSEGKIIAWDVRGAELQYYLWKVLGE